MPVLSEQHLSQLLKDISVTFEPNFCIFNDFHRDMTGIKNLK
jgi:hypothetical protein